MLLAQIRQQPLGIAVAGSAIGIAVFWVADAPIGLLAPIAAMFLNLHGRALTTLFAILGVGLACLVITDLLNLDGMQNLAPPWTAFFSTALCMGAIITTSALRNTSLRPTPIGVSNRSTPAYPLTGPTPEEKARPRQSTLVSIATVDDALTAELMKAASFWGGTPFHLRYWRGEANEGYSWTEVSTESVRHPSGIQQWNGISADIDNQRPQQDPHIRMAHSPPLGDEAVVAAKHVERLLGNAWAFDRAGRPTYLTPFAQTFVSVTLEEFQAASDAGDTFFKHTSHPDEYEHLVAAWRQSLETGAPFQVERRIRRASGIYDWSRTAIVPTRDSQGSITGWYGASMDLDAYRVAELALRDREQELSQLVDMVPSHLWRLTPEGEPVYFNKRMIKFLGFDIAEADRQGTARLNALIEAVHPQDKDQFRTILGDCLRTGHSFSMRYRLRRVDGAYHWMSSRAEPMRDQDGRIVQWYGLCHDIDDQMQAEEALRRSEQNLRELVETLPALIYCATPDGEPIYRSQKLKDYLGFGLQDKDEAGRTRLFGTLNAVIHPDDLPAVKEDYNRSLSTGEAYARKHRLRRFDGTYRWVETRAGPMRNSDGKIVQWNGVCFDIEDQVRAQDELRQAQESLARASQATSLAELSASIAHEVNQPLAAIVANSHACQRWLTADPPNIERAQKVVERVIRDANSAAEVVSRIRALFKQSTVTREHVELSSVITEALDMSAEELARRGVKVVKQIDDNLPLMVLDRVQIQQALINLMRNGMEAMDCASAENTLEIHTRTEGGEVRVEIHDHGPGLISPDNIFTPFYTTKSDGMGMGLAICRTIIESHSGRIWAENKQPHGATLVFTLPVEVNAVS